MKKIKNNLLKKKLNKINILFIIGIILIGLTIAFTIIASYNVSKYQKNATYLNDIIMEEDNKEEENAYLKVAYKPYSFAKYTDIENEAFYIIYDGNYYYIVYMNDNLFNKLNTDEIEQNPINIYGITKSTDTEIKELALEAFNEELDSDKKITIDDFNSYFGNVYLDTSITNNTSSVLYILAILSCLFAIIILAVYMSKKHKINKTLKQISDKELSKIEKELENKDTIYYDKAKLILTKNYIISLISGLNILPYKNLICIYERNIKQSKELLAIDIKGENHIITGINELNKQSKEKLKEIKDTITNKNKDILIELTRENKKLLKERIEK